MATKRIQCKSCGKEIVKNTKSCPNCGGKNKKLFYQRAWFIVVCVIIVIGAIGGGDDDKTELTGVQEAEIELEQIEIAKNEQKEERNQADENNTSKSKPEASSTDISNVKETNLDWEQFLVDYEAWIDEYIVFMEKYKEKPNDSTLISDYSILMIDMIEWSEQASTIEEELNADDLVEYMKTMTRIVEKLDNAIL